MGLVTRRLYRCHCKLVDGLYVKPLETVRDNLSRVIMVDNSIICYSLNPENALPIKSWYGDKNDVELLHLLKVSSLINV